MQSKAIVASLLCGFGTSLVVAQEPVTQGPGLKASEDARYVAEIAACEHHHPVVTPFLFSSLRPIKLPPSDYKPPAEVEGIPGIIAAGAHWHAIWHESGNNADGIVGTPDGVLVAQQDKSDVVLVSQTGHVKTVYQDTNSGGAVSINKQGQTFAVERGFHQGIWELAPEHKLLANQVDGDSIDCLGAPGGLDDLAAASNGGVYVTIDGLYYAAPDGSFTRQGDVTGTDGIILSPDERHLYVAAGGFTKPVLVSFDVQPNGTLANEHVMTALTGHGDGSTVDSEGRIYITAMSAIDIISPDGKLLGVIPSPRGDFLVTTTFGDGAHKHTLYAVGINPKFSKGGTGMPSDRQEFGGELLAIPMLSQRYDGRPK